MSEWTKEITLTLDVSRPRDPLIEIDADGMWRRITMPKQVSGSKPKFIVKFAEPDGAGGMTYVDPEAGDTFTLRAQSRKKDGTYLYAMESPTLTHDADGFEGIVSLNTKELVDALKDYKSIYTTIEATLTNSDGEIKYAWQWDVEIERGLDAGPPYDVTPVPEYMETVPSATEGNLASFDADGQVQDSGSKPADFATAAQGQRTNAGPTWSVYYDGDAEVYVAVGNKGRAALSNASFSALMNSITQSQARCDCATIELVAIPNGEYPIPTNHRYIVDAPIYVDYTCTIRGMGNPTTRIRAADGFTGEAMFIVGYNADILSLSVFENLRFDNVGVTLAGDVPFIKFYKAAEPVLRHCEFGRSKGAHVIYARPSSGHSHWAQVESCWFVLGNDNATGILIEHAEAAAYNVRRELHVHDCLFINYATGTTCIHAKAYAGALQVDNCGFRATSTGNSGTAIRVTDASGVRITNNWFDGYATDGQAILFDPATPKDFNALIAGNHGFNNTSTKPFIDVNTNTSGIAVGPNAVDFASLTDAADAQLDAAQAGLLTVADATADTHALNRQTGDARYVRMGGARYLIVGEAASDAQRGAALLSAYAIAKTMTPTANSPVTVLIPPGTYDLGSTGITLDTAYIHLVALVPAKVKDAGLSTMTLEPTVKLTADTGETGGTVQQTANNVLISDIEIVNTTDENPEACADTDPAAYWPSSGVTGTVLRRVKITGQQAAGGNAWATRLSITYAQAWDECLIVGFGSVGGDGATVSGTIRNCTISGIDCVGGDGGTVSGTIRNCTISGIDCVGGYGGTVSGTIRNCTISGNYCVGGYYGEVSGTIRDCVITGDYCVGSGGTIAATARLYDVTVSGTSAMDANSVGATAEFHHVRGVPVSLPALGGKYYSCVLTNGTIVTSGEMAVDMTGTASVSVPDASNALHALNQQTGDARYALKEETQSLTVDGAKSITVTAHHTVVNAAMNATATVTLNDPATTTRPYRLDIVFTQDSTGGRVLTLAGNVTTPGGVQPVLSTAPNAVDVLSFIWTGATWRLIGATFAHGSL